MAKTHAKRELTRKQQKTIGITAISIAVVLLAVIVIFVGIPLVRFLKEPERFRVWVEERGFWGKVAFIGMVVMKVVVAVIPGEPFELAAGYAFGVWEGLLLCMIGITIGSMIVFSLVKKFGVSIIRVFFSQERIDGMKLLHTSKKGNIILSIVYIVPGTPKDFLNYCAGLTTIKLHTWLLVCSIGRIPSIITSTISGDAFVQKRYFFGILIYVVTFLVGLIGVLVYNKVTKASEKINSETPQESSR
ncbi:MAG: TVP38/TMEM64 family protein [Spirochaetales bacterium]|nr:TVP38/TMEM64 family protein [Spirochaetales bacterium]